MRYLDKLLILVITICYSCGCKNTNNEDRFLVNVNETNAFVGEWDYVNETEDPGSFEIHIQADSTFLYYSHNSSGHGYSMGAWIIENNKIILTSYEPEFNYQTEIFYRENPSVNDEFVSDTVRNIRVKEKLVKSESFDFYLLFDNDAFRQKNDTLFYVHKKGVKFKQRIILIKKR
jgi:hypothetical protein